MKKFSILFLIVATLLVIWLGARVGQLKTASAAAASAANTPTHTPSLGPTRVLKLESGAQEATNKFVPVENASPVITDVVMSNSVNPDTYAPVGITNTFPATTEKFYAVVTTTDAPKGTIVKAEWIAVEIGSAAPPNTIITEAELEIEGTVNIAFSLTPDAGRLPGGSYKVNVYVNNGLSGSIGFSVEGAGVQPSGSVVSRIVPFHETQGTDPVDNNGQFPTGTTKLQLAVYHTNAPAGTTLGAEWIGADLGSAAPPNTSIAKSQQQVEGTDMVVFSLSSNSGALPDGKYKVNLSVNGQSDQSVELDVGGAISQPTASAPINPTQITFAGDIDAGYNSVGLTLDAEGNLYAAQAGGVRKMSKDGTQLAEFGKPSFNFADGMFGDTLFVAVDSDGNLYIADRDANGVQKLDRNGNFLTKWGGPTVPADADGGFDDPNGIALDSQGNVYVADIAARRVQKFDSNGKLLAKWEGPTYEGWGATGIALDREGNLYVTDVYGNRIFKLDPNGNVLAKWGSYGTKDGEFDGVGQITFDAQGNLYAVDFNNHRVQVFDSSGKFLGKFGTEPSGQLTSPLGIAITPDGTIYVSQFYSKVIRVFSAGSTPPGGGSPPPLTQPSSHPSGAPSNITFVGKLPAEPALSVPHGLVLDAERNLYIGEVGYIRKVDSEGKLLGRFGGPGYNEDGKFISVAGVAVDREGNIYAADPNSFVVQKLDSTGKFLLKWGCVDKCTTDSELNQAYGLAVGPDGNVYVADTLNSAIKKFDPNGKFIQKWTGAGSAGAFKSPIGIQLDAQGNMYIADTANHRVVVLDSKGNLVTQWGKPGTGEGEFNGPWALALDATNNVYVTDWGNQRVQVFDKAGRFLTQFGSKGTGDGQFDKPVGIAVAPGGAIIVSDGGNQTIQVFRPGGSSSDSGATPTPTPTGSNS